MPLKSFAGKSLPCAHANRLNETLIGFVEAPPREILERKKNGKKKNEKKKYCKNQMSVNNISIKH